MSETPGWLQPGARHTIWTPAADSERFAPGSFDHQVGSVVPLTYRGAIIDRARIIKAEVQHDGSGVFLTYEIL